MTTEAIAGQDGLNVLVEIKMLRALGGRLRTLLVVTAGGCWQQSPGEAEGQCPGKACGIRAKRRCGDCEAWVIDRQFDPLPGSMGPGFIRAVLNRSFSR